MAIFASLASAADGSLLSPRATIIEADSNGQDNTTDLRTTIYPFTVPNSLGSVKAVEGAIACSHENPVNRQRRESLTDWQRSSARLYRQHRQRAIRLEVFPTMHGPTWDFYV